MLEFGRCGRHHKGRTGDEVKALENAVSAGFRDEVALYIREVPGQVHALSVRGLAPALAVGRSRECGSRLGAVGVCGQPVPHNLLVTLTNGKKGCGALPALSAFASPTRLSLSQLDNLVFLSSRVAY
jgi:hypothetical protein